MCEKLVLFGSSEICQLQCTNPSILLLEDKNIIGFQIAMTPVISWAGNEWTLRFRVTGRLDDARNVGN